MGTSGTSTRSLLAGRAAVGIAAVLFGTSGVAVTLVAPGLDPVTAAGWRIVIGGLALTLLTGLRKEAPWRYELRPRLILLGGFAFLVFQLGFFAAVGRSGVATATIVTIGTGPIAAGVLDHRQYGVVPGSRWCIGIFAAVAGIAVMSGSGGVTVDPLGLLYAITAGCCFPLFGSAIRDLTADRPALTAIATVFATAGVPAAVLLLVIGSNPLASIGVTTVLLYLGLITTAAAYSLWARGLAVLTLSETVTVTMLEPIAAAALAVLILHEHAGVMTAVGAAAATVGVWIATTRAHDRVDRRAGA